MLLGVVREDDDGAVWVGDVLVLQVLSESEPERAWMLLLDDGHGGGDKTEMKRDGGGGCG